MPPYSGTLVAFSPLCGGGTGGEGPWWGEPTLPTGCRQDLHPHAPPHADQLNGELTASKTKASRGLGKLSLIFTCGRHQMMMNPKSFATIASIQEKKRVQILGNGRKEPKKRDAPGGKGEVLLGAGRAQNTFPVDQGRAHKQACGRCVRLLVSALEQHSYAVFSVLRVCS